MQLAADEERLETLQIIQNQLAEVDDGLAVKLLRQAEISDESHLEQEIQVLQDRINRTRQKMTAATSNVNQVKIGKNSILRRFVFGQLNISF